MNYEELLKKALSKVKKSESGERFEIPTVIIEREGNKTVWRNFYEVCDYLRRDPKQLAKYFSRELAAPFFLREKFLVFNAVFQRETIQKKLEAYVKSYVFCKQCSKPDTKILKRKRNFFIICEACGAEYPIQLK